MRVNLGDMALVLGVSSPTVKAWATNDGLPTRSRGGQGKEWEFDTVEVIAWWAATKWKPPSNYQQGRANPFGGRGDDPETIEEASRRKEIAHADRAEVAVAKDAGLLVPVDEVVAVIVEENVRVRSRVLAIPNEIRPAVLTHLKNDRKAAEQLVSLVEGVIYEALSEIQAYGGGADAADA